MEFEQGIGDEEFEIGYRDKSCRDSLTTFLVQLPETASTHFSFICSNSLQQEPLYGLVS